MNKGFDARIAQTSDGNVVVRVGCKLFVGEPKDLKALATYYAGEVPRGYKKLLDGTIPWDGDGSVCEHGDPVVVPHRLTGAKSAVAVTKADNGYVVRMGDVDVVYKAGTAVAQGLDQLFEEVEARRDEMEAHCDCPPDACACGDPVQADEGEFDRRCSCGGEGDHSCLGTVGPSGE